MPDLGFFSWDKFLHAFAYGLLTLFGGLAFRGVFRSDLLRWSVAGGVALAFGALLEVGQHLLTSRRRADWVDLLADALGIVLVWSLVYSSRRLRSRRRREAR